MWYSNWGGAALGNSCWLLRGTFAREAERVGCIIVSNLNNIPFLPSSHIIKSDNSMQRFWRNAGLVNWPTNPADRQLALAKLLETMMNACVASELLACKGDHINHLQSGLPCWLCSMSAGVTAVTWCVSCFLFCRMDN